jgi:hypothetical protein
MVDDPFAGLWFPIAVAFEQCRHNNGTNDYTLSTHDCYLIFVAARGRNNNANNNYHRGFNNGSRLHIEDVVWGEILISFGFVLDRSSCQSHRRRCRRNLQQ